MYKILIFFGYLLVLPLLAVAQEQALTLQSNERTVLLMDGQKKMDPEAEETPVS